MKNLIKRTIPESLFLIAQKVYWKLLTRSESTALSEVEFEALEVLKCKISYNKYGGYCIPLSSQFRPAAQKILAKDIYEPKTIEYILSNCDNGDIIHAGTYFGDFLPALAKGIAPGAKVLAFEPNPENYRCARITLEINDISNIVLTNAGLGNKRETLLVRTTDTQGRALGGASQIIAGKSVDPVGSLPVQIVTIDDSVDPDRVVSIIQLDVEGYEKQALTGALKTIRRCLPIIILEVLPNSELLESKWFADNIISLGYREIHNIHDNFVFSCIPNNEADGDSG